MAAAAQPAKSGEPLVILAGGGDFPVAVARRAVALGVSVLVVGIRDEAGSEIAQFPHDWVKRGELGRLFRIVRRFRARRICLIGTIRERRLPTWREIDVIGLLTVFRFRRLLLGGDDSVLRKIARLFEARGLAIVSAADIAPELLAPRGSLGRVSPSAQDRRDIEVARAAALDLGRRDLGQAVVAADGVVVALEDRTGTDHLLDRVASDRQGTGARGGVLLKCLKPGQDPRLDMPAIGPTTVDNAARAGLAGIAVEARRTLVTDRDAVVARADEMGLFVHGFTSEFDLDQVSDGELT